MIPSRVNNLQAALQPVAEMFADLHPDKGTLIKLANGNSVAAVLVGIVNDLQVAFFLFLNVFIRVCINQ